MKKKTVGVGIVRKQTLHGQIARACQSCGAGGVFHDIPDVNVGCFDPARKGQYVGDICPNCGANRAPLEQRGKMWAKNFYPSTIPAWLASTLEWFNRRLA